MIKLSELLDADNVRSEAKFIGETSKDGWPCIEYRVTLKRGRKRMATPFYMGIARTQEPSTMDVMSSLVLDSWGYERATGVLDWCEEYGYEAGPEARKTYAAVKAQAARLGRFLGDDYRRYLDSEVDN